MRFTKANRMTAAVLAAAGWAGAHLTPNSLSFTPAAPFTAGQAVTVKWQVAVSHGFPINIDYSGDGGSTWKSLKSGLSDASGPGSFAATMPSEPTTKGLIRVCQGSASECANIKASQPSTPPYTLVSSAFSITGTSALAADAAAPFAMGLEAAGGKIEGSFALAQAGEVTLQAFDLQGRLLATLLHDRLAAGAHRLSLAAPRGLASASAVVFRLKAGGSVRALAWTRP